MSRFSQSSLVIIMALIISLGSIIAIAFHFLTIEDKSILAPPVSTATIQVPADSSITRPTGNDALAALFSLPVSDNKVKIDKDNLASLWFEQSFDDGVHQYHTIFIKTQIVEDMSLKVTTDDDESVNAQADDEEFEEDFYGGHADAPLISAVVYKQVNGKWEVASKQKNIGVFGSWGNAPKIKQAQLLKLAKGNVAFLLDISYSGQGYTHHGKSVFSYYENAWVQVGYLQTGGNNAGVCDDASEDADELLLACWHFNGKISLAENEDALDDYPDLIVNRTGTMMGGENGRVVKVKDSLYGFNGEEYLELTADGENPNPI